MRKEESLTDVDYEALLPEVPPSAIVNAITPWHKAVNLILIGLALTSVTLNVFLLNYILPFLGMILLLLGFRILHRESSWFHLCWLISIIRIAGQLCLLILNATIYRELLPTATITAINVAGISLQMVQLFALWRGLRRIRRTAGLSPGSGSALALLLWYGLLIFLGLSGQNILVVGILMIAGYFCLLRCLYKISKELDTAGYAIASAPVRVADWFVSGIITLMLVLGIACGYRFFHSYPMEWTVLSQTQDAPVTEVQTHLESLGFPSVILNDLTPEDILACEGAIRVACNTEELPMNNGRTVTSKIGSTYHSEQIYDIYELTVTSVAVELPGEVQRWKIFHHFQWTVPVEFYGTELVYLVPAYQGDAWNSDYTLSGRLLYEKDGTTYTADYYALYLNTYETWGGTNYEPTAKFSLPNEGCDHRGYVSYTISAKMDTVTVVSSWIYYYHQTRWAQYPVSGKPDTSLFAENSTYIHRMGSLGFTPWEDRLDLWHERQ